MTTNAVGEGQSTFSVMLNTQIKYSMFKSGIWIGCHELRVLPGAKTFSNISARIWHVLSNKINCDVSTSICKCIQKLFLLHNELVLKYPK